MVSQLCLLGQFGLRFHTEVQHGLVRDFVWRSDGPAGASFNGGAGG
jgi:hypothetical protein